jgi:hypothetical protein
MFFCSPLLVGKSGFSVRSSSDIFFVFVLPVAPARCACAHPFVFASFFLSFFLSVFFCFLCAHASGYLSTPTKLCSCCPHSFRPASKLGDKTFENPQTTALQKVLQGQPLAKSCFNASAAKRADLFLIAHLFPCVLSHLSTDCKDLYDATAALKTLDHKSAEGTRLLTRQFQAWYSLQVHVNVLMDSSLDPKARANGVCCVRMCGACVWCVVCGVCVWCVCVVVCACVCMCGAFKASLSDCPLTCRRDPRHPPDARAQGGSLPHAHDGQACQLCGPVRLFNLRLFKLLLC